MDLELIDAIESLRPERHRTAESVPLCAGAPRVSVDAASTPRAEDPHEEPQRTAELRERIKELNCLIMISKLAESHNSSQNDMLQAAVEIIPTGWKYPVFLSSP